MQRAYTKQIIERDRKCFLSHLGECTEVIHLHHIKTRGSGGSDEYDNLIMLCSHHHLDYAHGKDGDLYKKQFQEYTSQCTRPDNWDDVMVRSKKQWENFRKYWNGIGKKQREKYKATQKPKIVNKPEKSAYQYNKEKFIEKHGVSPRKYNYQKMKEAKQKKSCNQE